VNYDVTETEHTGDGKKDVVQSRHYTTFVVGGLNENRHQLWNDTAGKKKLMGGCKNVTFSTTKRTWTEIVVTLVIRNEKPATDVYPICKSAQTDPGKQMVL